MPGSRCLARDAWHEKMVVEHSSATIEDSKCLDRKVAFSSEGGRWNHGKAIGTPAIPLEPKQSVCLAKNAGWPGSPPPTALQWSGPA